MIQLQTILKVMDNSGAKYAKCIKILGGFKHKFAYTANTVIVSIQRLKNKSKIISKVKKGEIYKGLIIRTKRHIKKKDGLVTFFDENCVSLINKHNNPLAHRIFGSVPRILKHGKHVKFATIAAGFV
jgi:large subunit ribosomal protein L14